MTLKIREVTGVSEVAVLRAADEVECRAAGMTGAQAVIRSIALSFAAFEATWKGEVVAYWGYAPPSLLGTICYCWLLTTPVANDIPLVVAKASRVVVDSLLLRYPTLIVNVDLGHALAVRWLTWLGFVHCELPSPYTQMRLDRKIN